MVTLHNRLCAPGNENWFSYISKESHTQTSQQCVVLRLNNGSLSLFDCKTIRFTGNGVAVVHDFNSFS